MLPEINGYELLEYIKPIGTPVIFLTAKSGVDDRIK
jgi:DNA-binding response OmpR family regulator